MTGHAAEPWPDDDVILYDGVCVFCSRWIRFVATRDKARRFRFTAIQSGYGARLAQAFGIDPEDPDTNAVVHGGVAWFKSDGALTVLGALPGWGWVRVLRGVPAPFPKVFGDNAFGRGLVKLNQLAIALSKTLFSYQIFVVAESTPDVNFVLRDTEQHSQPHDRARDAGGTP